MKRNVTVYITKKGEERRERIKQFFGIKGFNINGEAELAIDDTSHMWQMLQITAARGFVQIRDKSK